MPAHPTSSAELERQRARIDALPRDGWIVKAPHRPPESVPQRRPFIEGVEDDAEVIITNHGARPCVAILFSHRSFPGVRFGHRFTPSRSLEPTAPSGGASALAMDSPKASAPVRRS